MAVQYGNSTAPAQREPRTDREHAAIGANLMVIRNDRFEIERIKQLLLILAAPPHHRCPRRNPNLA